MKEHYVFILLHKRHSGEALQCDWLTAMALLSQWTIPHCDRQSQTSLSTSSESLQREREFTLEGTGSKYTLNPLVSLEPCNWTVEKRRCGWQCLSQTLKQLVNKSWDLQC